ncbi:MAG: cysteine-rich CWC family protein [Chlamydiae bacterium]|nr:cysteine-rich CWC family protein [Chlamydiota bacterium]MBI3277129.1 cysteine-rich CWC family protein [Chlamydiota bacterium]
MEFSKTKIKICPRCKRSFSCQQEEGCWCSKLKFSKEILEKIRAAYSDCLCEYCLKGLLISSHSKNDQLPL